MISLDLLASLMAGDGDDQRAARLLIEGEALARGAICAIRELADSGYEDEAERLADELREALREL